MHRLTPTSETKTIAHVETHARSRKHKIVSIIVLPTVLKY